MRERETLMVHVLDEDKVREAALTVFAMQYGIAVEEVSSEGWDVDFPLVIAPVGQARKTRDIEWTCPKKRSYAVICTEGVGWECDMSGRLDVPLVNGYGSMTDVQISSSYLWRLRSEETVDLASHIRTFGSRLETNYWIWNRRIHAAAEN